MVDPGQFLERMTVIPVGESGPTLEALYHRGKDGRGVVLVGGHTALGGLMDGPVLSELVWLLARAGHPTLRFNYRGVGASTGEPAVTALDAEALVEAFAEDATRGRYVEDLAAAVGQHRETVEQGRLALVAYSFGAAVALRYLEERRPIAKAILISPPIALLPERLPTDVEVCVVHGTDDVQAPREELERRFGAEAVVSVPGANHLYARGLSLLGTTVVKELAP